MRKPSPAVDSAPIIVHSVMPKVSNTLAPQLRSIFWRLASESGSAEGTIFLTPIAVRSMPDASARLARWMP
ncbi:hypothetical protein D3C83_49200 [compost metagenome]